MKKALLLAACMVAASVSSFAQGTVVFNNRVPADGVDARVFNIDGVTPLEGAQFSLQLWGGPSEAALAPISNVATFRTGAGGGYMLAADAAVVTVPGVAGGGTGFFELRAWDNTTGATWETASVFGQSAVFQVSGLGDPTANPPTLPPSLVGAQSFQLIPEPSTIALAVFGAFALLLRRRKQ